MTFSYFYNNLILLTKNISSSDNGTMTYTGSSTVSMPDAPIVDVPTTIKVSGEIISIFPYRLSVDGHFGDTPIYAATSIGHDNDNIEGHHRIALESNSNIATNSSYSNRSLNYEFLRQHQRFCKICLNLLSNL
jgi:hypothetical protein